MFANLRTRQIVVTLFSLLLGSIPCAFRLGAQTTTATISGTVSDASGAVVAGANVQARNVATGIAQSVSTDVQGRYSLPDLQVGTYDVQASQAGFQTMIHAGVTLTVGGQTVVDFALQVGQVTQAVTVQSEVAQIETVSSELGSLVTPTQMSQLPLNGRDFEQLISLSQGVQIVNTGNHNAFYGMANEYSVAGARPEGALELLDDSVLNTFWNHGTGAASLGTAMGVEAIAEFNTLVNTYGAQFGGNGAVINATTKSGTNDLHGTVYEYLRNSALDARNWTDPATIPAFRRNQFGASLGGPIKKDKLFFFANYEGLRQTLGESRLATVPDTDARAGYLPCGPAASSYLITCPGGTTTGTEVAVNNKAVGTGPCTSLTFTAGSNCVTNSLVQAVLNTYPNPIGGGELGVGGGYQLTEVANQQGQEDYGVARLDYHISNNDSLLGRYIIDNAYRFEPFNPQATTIPLWPENDYTRNQYLTIEETHIFSPQLINVARFGWAHPNAYGSAAPLTTPALSFVSGREGGQLSVTGLSTIGVDNLHLPYNFPVSRFTAADDISWTRGAHNFRFGMEVDRAGYNDSAPFYLGGSYSFNSLALLMQGNVNTLNMAPPGVNDAYRDIRQTEIYPYAQDQWRVSRRLTLNLGLRYEFISNPTCNACNQVIDHFTAVPTPPNYDYVALAHVFKTNPSKYNFAPRIGFALDPFNGHKTAIRGGVGVFYDDVAPRTYLNQFWQAPPNYNISLGAQQNVTFPTAPSAIQNDLNNGTLPAQSLVSGGSYDISRTPLVIEYNLNVQHEFWDHTVLLVGYVGSAGENLIATLDQNPNTFFINAAGQEQFGCNNSDTVDPQCAGTGAKVVVNNRVNPATLYGSQSEPLPVGYSRYNSLQVSMNHPMAHDVQMAVNYTYSQCIDDGSITFNQESNGTGQVVSNPWNLAVDRGPCAFDITHHISVNSLVNLPFHTNHLNRLVGGWQLAPILLYATGSPFSVTDGFNYTGLNANDRPNVVPGCNPLAGAGTRAEWFNPSCFTLQPVGTLGNLGRNTLNLPPSLNVDFGLLKDIPVNERFKVQFRAEFFNIFNIQSWGPPNIGLFTQSGGGGTLNTSTPPGQITTFQNGLPEREIQFALKLLF